ncbi:MAG: hypothetical protein ACRDNF_05815 [Streptosporangiaceae bacterium]
MSSAGSRRLRQARAPSWVRLRLARAQRTGAIRTDITTADLMALISGIIFALRPRSASQADPQRAVAVLRDGLRTTPS